MRHGMSDAHGLADIDAPQLVLIPQQIVLAQVGVNELTVAMQAHHQVDHLGPDVLEQSRLANHILQGGGRATIAADEGHDQDVLLQQQHLRAWNAGPADSILERTGS